MTCAPALTISLLAAQAYADGYATHGEIGLKLETFENRLRSVVEKHLGRDTTQAALKHFFCPLHSNDLYLTVACAQSSDAAWRCFEMNYRKFINDIARYMTHSADAGSEVAAEIMAILFMPDRSGQSRIASFDGRQSLATWLRVIVSRRAINRNALKWNSFENLDRPKNLTDNASITKIDAALRRGRYEAVAEDCFREACGCLTARERLIVLLRYDQGLRLVEIAKSLALHRSMVLRSIQSAQSKLQQKILSVLSTKYHFGPSAIQECLAEMLENPSHSPLLLLKQSEITNKVRSVSRRS